ncbi:MAG: FAD:protein FMN transferase [Ahrensia sp.]|nr:FAD:protein FMN transferase [Ahrensia sp.]
MISRRRFLAIAAAGACIAPSTAEAQTVWRGHAFGSEISIALSQGIETQRQRALGAALDTIRRMENLFSLYDPTSALSRLNRNGRLRMPPEFARLFAQCHAIHALTHGLFDPTVQPLFATLKADEGLESGEMKALIKQSVGWRHIQRTSQDIFFGRPGMAMTLNGIAQGFSTDRVTETLAAHGFTEATVNIGEYRCGDSTTRIAITNDGGRSLHSFDLRSGAVATSSTTGFTFANGRGHILSPTHGSTEPVWRTLSVVADNAALADGLSTALCLADDESLAETLLQKGTIRLAVLERTTGEVLVLGG